MNTRTIGGIVLGFIAAFATASVLNTENSQTMLEQQGKLILSSVVGGAVYAAVSGQRRLI